MDARQTTEALIALQGCPVLVVGDVMLDRFVDGKVTRMSPEAPVPVLDQTSSTEMPGGGANVACNLAALGCDVQLVAITGDDSAANTLSTLLDSNMAIDFSRISDSSRPTTRKTRYRADGQQVLRVDEELTDPISEEMQQQLFGEVRSQMASAQAIILSDYAKGCMPVPLMQNIIKAANEAGKPVIADPKLADFSSYAGVDLLTPNLAELRTASALSDDTLDIIAAAAGGLAVAHNIGAILATLSARGMLLAHADGSWTHAPAEARAVFDVSGAGDTVVAMLAACIAASIRHEDALSLANMAAGIVVGKSGTAVVSPGELITTAGPAGGPTQLQQATQMCAAWQKDGQRVGFTNGCFDLLHPGHLKLLTSAANESDRLIVGLNSDASVRRLKGDGRPVQSTATRAAALAQLPFVDAVTVFDQDTPFELITTLQPDRLFKGGDYRAANVVGRDVVAARGGDVIIIPTLGSHSTSALITF